MIKLHWSQHSDGVPISITILSCMHNFPVTHGLLQQVATSSSQYFCHVVAVVTSLTCHPGCCGHGGWGLGCARHATAPSLSLSLCCVVGMPLQTCHHCCSVMQWARGQGCAGHAIVPLLSLWLGLGLYWASYCTLALIVIVLH